MAIPFLSYFKKKAKPEPDSAPVAVAPLEKKSSDRMSKTVMPSAARAAAPTAHAPAPAYAQSSTAAAPMPAAGAPRSISFGGASPVRAADFPPAVALALEPTVERTVSIELADVVREMPEGVVRALEGEEASRRILFKASELERGMANGKPAVALTSVYEQVPEIFTRSISPDDKTQVALPFSVVLEQFSNLQTRSDQQRPTEVPQVQTPFLKVTMEDNQRFGIETELREIVDLPTVRVEPATAASIAAAEPEPIAKETLMSMPPPKPDKPFSLRPAAPTNGSASAPSAPANAPARIPFKLTPNGTDAPAPERVPASSGPSVPTSLPTAAGTPTRIPFKITAPSDDIRPKPEPWMTKATLAAEANGEAPTPMPTVQANGTAAAATIKLPLKSIFESLPPMQLAGDPQEIADEARIELPLALIEPQLVTGRVSIAPEQFAAALPQEYRGYFNGDAAGVPVSLPLQEVLKNLPSALPMREDQEEQEKGANFETPFSTAAQEDAKRLKVAAAPVAKAVVLPAPFAAPAEEPAERAIETPAPAPKPAPAPMKLAVAKAPEAPKTIPAPEVTTEGGRNALQEALQTDEEMDAKAVVAHVGKMEGVKACAIMFGDGLSLAGTLPAEYEADGLCAMAPALLQKVENHMVETKLGSLRAMTLSCAKAAVTFFMHNNLCLAALHAEAELAADIRERLGRTVQELSRQYSHPA